MTLRPRLIHRRPSSLKASLWVDEQLLRGGQRCDPPPPFATQLL